MYIWVHQSLCMSCHDAILSLAGMKLIFFVAAHMVQCFVFVIKQCWQHTNTLATADQCLHSIETFSGSHSTPASSLGVVKTRQSGREHSWDRWAPLTKDRVSHTTHHHTQQQDGDGQGRSSFWETGWALVCLWEVVGECFCINSLGPFFPLSSSTFLPLLNSLYLNPHVTMLLLLLFSGRTVQVSLWRLSCWLVSVHHST